MTDASGAHEESQCCGGHGHEQAGAAGMCSADAACGSHAEAGACCGGHAQAQDDVFAFPTTSEVVSIPAVQLAGLLDLVEKLAPDLATLASEVDYQESQKLLAQQAPELVALRDAFLERMKSLLAEVSAGHAAQ